jgi:hypothetical protein
MTEETEKTVCYRHPQKETKISCNECGRYICPSCMIPAPVGQKCPECVTSYESHTTRITPTEYTLSILTGGIVSLVTCFFWQYLPSGFLMAISAYLIGFLVAKSITAVIGNKLGFKIQVIAGTLVFIGMLYNPLGMAWDFITSGYDPIVMVSYIQRPFSMMLALISNPFGNLGPLWLFISVMIGIWAAVRHFKF